LIELLVVLAILGIVIGAVQSLYVAHQRSATMESETVDVQQNLRIGLDQIARDISMAGFMVSAPTNPIANFTNGASGAPDGMALNTGSQEMVAATVNSLATTVTVGVGTLLDLSVLAFGTSIGGFESADENVSRVRIVNYRGQPLGNGVIFTVILVRPSSGVCGAVAAPCLRLQATTVPVGTGTGVIERGDTIVKTSVGAAEAFPHMVAYAVAACPSPLAGNCLMRITTPGGASVVATNVTNVQFSYLLNGTVETAAPTDLSLVRAVRVTIAGQLVDTAAGAGGNLKPRSLTTIVAIRNA
jgi:type II secretory pathway pseudopilin PulG